MPEIKDQRTISVLAEQLSEKIQAFKDSLEDDKIFEIRREILRDIRTLENKIALLKQEER